jgi:hypothetical protein
MPRWRWCIGSILLLACWMAGSLSSNAQAPLETGTLTGVVVDPSGARIPRATLHFHGDHLDIDGMTTASGVFAVTLPAGLYTLTVQAPGFRELTKDTKIEPGGHHSLSLRLSIDVAAEIISVNPWTGVDDRTNSLNFSGDQLQVLSDDPETLRQQLTAMAGGGTGMLAPQFYIDGFSNGQVPPKSAIRAIHINSNPYSAVYDHPGFGRVEIETQAGGNQLHGMFDAGGTSNEINSGNPFTNEQPPYYQLLFRGDVSGPIRKKTSYFLAGNTSDLQNNAIVNAVNPLSLGQQISEAVPDPQRDDDYSLRLDHQFSAANQINGRYEVHRLHQINAGVGLLVLPEEGYTSNALTQTLQLADNEIVSPKIVNDARFQYIRTRTNQNPNSTAATVIVQGAFSGGGSPMQTTHDNQDQYEFQDNASIDHRNHFIRAGMRYRLFRDSNSSNGGFNGEYVYPDVASYPNLPTQSSINVGQQGAAVSTGDLSVYAEDDWKLSRAFTLNYGLRYETQSAIPDHNDPAPRVGFAWAVGRKTAKVPIVTLRGGAGLFYQRLSATDLMPSVRQNGVNQIAYVVQNPDSSFPSTQTTIYQLDPRLKTSHTLVASITAERIIGKIGSITANFLEADGRHAYLLRNANAPLPGTYDPTDPLSGVRPLGGNQNIYQDSAEGTGHAQMFFTNVNLNPRRWLYLFAFYVAGIDHSDANGTSWFVSNSYNIRQDYGRDDSDTRQQFYMGTSINLPHGLAVRPFLSARSGRPFNITTGTDLNGDTIYNDRPAFATDLSRPSVVHTSYGNFDTDPLPSQTVIPYNYGHGPALAWVDMQLSEQLHIGPRPSTVIAQPGSPAGPNAHPARTPERPWTLEFSLEVENLFNHTNGSTPVGVLSSPLFGQSLSVATDFSSLTAANRTLLLHSTFTF